MLSNKANKANTMHILLFIFDEWVYEFDKSSKRLDQLSLAIERFVQIRVRSFSVWLILFDEKE